MYIFSFIFRLFKYFGLTFRFSLINIFFYQLFLKKKGAQKQAASPHALRANTAFGRSAFGLHYFFCAKEAKTRAEGPSYRHHFFFLDRFLKKARQKQPPSADCPFGTRHPHWSSSFGPARPPLLVRGRSPPTPPSHPTVFRLSLPLNKPPPSEGRSPSEGGGLSPGREVHCSRRLPSSAVVRRRRGREI